MKRLLLIAMLITACSKDRPMATQTGVAESFKVLEKSFYNGIFAVENSYVYHNDNLVSLYDLNASGEMTLVNVGDDLKSYANEQSVLKQGARFSYVFEHDGIYKNFVTRASKIHLLTSTDLVNWNEEGIVLDNDANRNSYRHQQWNAAVTYDQTGKAHMLLESGSSVGNQADVRLVYFTAPSGTNNFTEELTVEHVQGGGNAWIQHIPGKGLLSVHGSVHGENGEFWRIRASILPDGEAQWITAPINAFDIVLPGIHIADPHLIETKDGKILMSLSYDQVSSVTYLSRSDMTFATLFDLISESL
ncbi:MAG: hypothetical protein GY861_17800 [bacterium]|nr:hypothetical protein [bacterium]